MPKVTLLHGDCLEMLRTLPDCSVQCCVTSPPYYGLRDYGVDGQIGLEPTPEAYVSKLVEVFAEVRRVLRDDGVLWLNLGDSYASNGIYIGDYKVSHPEHIDFHTDNSMRYPDKRKGTRGGEYAIKPKDLIGIPWRVAFALQADGWWLRQDIIWNKPNPMPESVTDRCTKSHEYIFLLTKSARYFYDNEAVKEPVKAISIERSKYGWNCDRASTKNASMGGEGIHVPKMGTRFVNLDGRNLRSVWTITTKPYSEAHFATFPVEIPQRCIMAGSREGDTVLDPFNGAGTTGLAALKLGRDYVGIELNAEYIELTNKRLAPLLAQPGLFEVSHA